VLRAPQGVQLQIDVKIRPPEVEPVEQLDGEYRARRGVLEPRIFGEREKELLAIDVQPNAVPGDALNLSARRGASASVR